MVSRPWSAKAPDAEIAIVMSDQTCLTLSDLPRSLRMKAAIVLRRYFLHQPPTAAAPGPRRWSSPCTG